MRYTLSLLICALAVASVSAQANRTTYLTLARGIVEGISTAQGWSDITGCISNNDALTSGIADAIATFQLNNSETITPAAMKLGKALKVVPDALRTCNNTINISKTLLNTLSSISSLSNYVRIITNNLRTYNVDLVKEAIQGSMDYNNSRMREFGNKVGLAIGQVFLNGTGKVPPQPDANTSSVYNLVAQGVFEGSITGLKWDQVKPCLAGNTQSQTDLNNAIAYLQSSDAKTFAQGIAALGSALIDIPTAIQTCSGAKDKARRFLNALLTLQDLETYMRILKTNVAYNGIDIYEEIYTASQDLQVGAYKAFGTNVGLAVTKLFFDNISA